MQELVDMNHMEPLTETINQALYMPHHPVIKESRVTTKLRVVFNASAKTTSGNSLNDALFVGPQLQQDLVAILMRFRTHRYAVTAGVAKMYRQVCVSSKHLDLQRIVWRNDPSLPIQDYRMLHVTYGVAAASHLAVKSLQQTTKYSSNKSEQPAKVILKDFYMDDLLTGTSCKNELQMLQRNVSDILSEGGFELRKWASNCVELNENISNASKSISHYIAEGKDVHALGLIWDTEADNFTFAVNLKQPPDVLTKRARFGVPKVEWDDVVPDAIATQWFQHRSELRDLVNLKVNRWLGTGTFGSSTELHIFSDVQYPMFAGTDSTITLAWLQAHPSRWVTFIANRVADVQEVLPPNCWNHVRSEQNPADCASRGVTPSELLSHQLWWTGPAFLRTNKQFWKQTASKHHTTEVGARNNVPVHVVNPDEHWSALTNYSSY
ncbi:uncharacterized protein LOC118756835 [Rhagoletis pomonella]|uniref:uncharacterized protein LOC118756835 n=1 Tax=Rhagoletis pomonella TaxID=28610 RepID=UPI0017808721|nr:uncharacterized protein LOC118756835 [Rhagoletis pomonella]